MENLPDPTQLLVGALAFLRIGGILFAMPIVGDAPTPIRVRVLMALALTVGMYPLIQVSWLPDLTTDVFGIAGLVGRELLIGLVIGFISRVAFDGILMAASVVAYQMGFGTAHLFVPDYGGTMDGFTAFHRMVILLIFLTLGMHHIFFGAIADSFRLIPCGAAHLNGSVGTIIIEVTTGIMTIAVQLAAPVLVALLFTMAALGLVARTVPQMNVFVMSFPISFMVGLVVYIATLPFYPEWLREHFLESQDTIFAAMRGMVG